MHLNSGDVNSRLGQCNQGLGPDQAMMPGGIPCRICGENALFFFQKKQLNKYDVSYFRCEACAHIQTEKPYWLDEAYQGLSFAKDVGMAARSVETALTTVALARKLKLDPEAKCLDWGAGTGLFVRFCRDYGLNMFYMDRYAQNIFAIGWEWPEGEKKAGAASLFEVFEHFPDPVENLREVFAHSPEWIVFSTLLSEGKDENWWYFLPDGQHVAFYTRRSLEILGKKFGYHLASNDCDLHLFSKTKVKDGVLNWCRKHRNCLARSYKRKFGSRTLSDFERMLKETSEAAPR